MAMKQLRRKIMRTLMSILLIFMGARYVYGTSDGGAINTNNTDQTQILNAYGPGYSNAVTGDSLSLGMGGSASADGGDADALSYSGGSSSGAVANISSTSINKTKIKEPPLSVVPPYLPYWNHGGWGTIQAYFPNGPSSYNLVYERAFNPNDDEDMKQLKRVLKALPYNNPVNIIGGIFNGVRAVFGGPDYFHRGRGFEIANALVRDRRPDGKPILVFIDSNINRELLHSAGYAYVGRVSLEGDVDRNWDQVYDAAVAEALPWDVDIMLISGGMKGVTVGSNLSFPGAAGAYSHISYSLSFLGAMSSGITEGKGKAMVSAEGYRYWPDALAKRKIPRAFYEKIHLKTIARENTATTQPQQAQQVQPTATATATPPPAAEGQRKPGVKVSRELIDLAGFEQGQSIQNLVIQ
jgi:hypothetical protein